MKQETPFTPTETPPPPPNRTEGLRPGRHQLRAAEDYPMEEFEGTAYHIPKSDYPDGFDLQWIAVEVWNQPQPSMRAEFEKKGWQPIQTGDFDGKYDGKFIPRAQQGEMNMGGLVLCARPKSWSDKAKAIAERNARAQVSIKVNQLQRGELDRVTLDPQHKTAIAHNHVDVGVERINLPMPEPDGGAKR